MKGKALPLAFLFLVCLVPLALTVRPYFKLGNDAATYAILAENLASGRGYTYQGFPHVKYPPGFPALLSLVFAARGKDFLALRAFMALLAGCSLLAAWRFSAARHGERIGAAVLVSIGASAVFLRHAAFTLTDVPFLGLFCLAATASASLVRRPGKKKALLAGVLMALAASFRVVGLLLLPALVLSWFSVRRERRPWGPLLLAGLLVLLPAGLWFRYKATASPRIPGTLREGATYLQELRGGLWLGAPQGILPNVARQLRTKPFLLAGASARFLSGERIGGPGQGGWKSPAGPVSFFCLALLLFLVFRVAWRKREPADWFLPLYLAVLMVTPPFEGLRYLIPLLPLFFGGIYEGAAWIGGRKPEMRKWAVPAAVFLVLGIWTPVTWRAVARERAEPYYRGDEAPFVRSLEFLEKEAPPGAVTICNEAAVAHFLTSRPAWGFPLTTEEDARKWILEKGDLVLLSSWGYPVNEVFLRKAAAALASEGRLVPWKEFKGKATPGKPVPFALLLKVRK